MTKKLIEVWYDSEGDFLEVVLERHQGYFQETEDDRVMKKIDSKGRLLDFSTLGMINIKGLPLKVTLSEEKE
ncbi:MAG: DUF2283 domain-containing protein [SAR202 cluster bacterium]|nr:DUF2283 domain-containing protein [SAR202 cluster bacterium]